jgi:Ca2+-binding EF-hand superfamily protein
MTQNVKIFFFGILQYQVSIQNIKRIHKRFQKLDKNEKGFVSPTDFNSIPEIEKNNLGIINFSNMNIEGSRITDVLSDKEEKGIDFEKFIQVD